MDKPKKKEVNREKHQGSSNGYQVNGLPLHLTKYQNGYNQACCDWEEWLSQGKEG